MYDTAMRVAIETTHKSMMTAISNRERVSLFEKGLQLSLLFLAVFILTNKADDAFGGPIGLLILTPDERATVLSARKKEDLDQTSTSQRVRLDGILRRPDYSLWIAGQTVHREGEALMNGKRPRVADGAVLVGRLRWQVSETYDMATGQIESPLKWKEGPR